ncbi:hypothetical protein [Arthrobacter alpinus]|uniref:hypothetical protein n=1 Tax=Arthrobacter alpinus TaxID=656366 RepID=UPI0011147199|nr:hypothetical protein [Arthrobacter alpinus]
MLLDWSEDPTQTAADLTMFVERMLPDWLRDEHEIEAPVFIATTPWATPYKRARSTRRQAIEVAHFTTVNGGSAALIRRSFTGESGASQWSWCGCPQSVRLDHAWDVSLLYS